MAKCSTIDGQASHRVGIEMLAKETEIYFRFSASLRVMDAPECHAEIGEATGLKPSHIHLKGAIANEKSGRRWPNDIWLLASPLAETAELTEHLNWLWQQVQPHQDYFRLLVESGVKMDILCGYRSNCDHCGFGVDPNAVEIAQKLGIRLEFSVIIA